MISVCSSLLFNFELYCFITITTPMAIPSKFYATDESDALAWICEHIPSPRGVESPQVSYNEDTFLSGLQERSLSIADGGRSLEQPLFKRSAIPAAGEQSGLSIRNGSTSIMHENNEMDDDPSLALADFDYQYDRWSHANSGSHPQDSTATSANRPTTSQQFLSQSVQDENAGPSKMAALIAKSKAKPASSGAGILTSQSISQKRAALHKNKHRKSIIETPAQVPDMNEPVPSKSKRVELMYDNTPEGRRRALDLAIKEGIIDPDNDEQVTALMKRFVDPVNKKIKDNATVMERLVDASGAVLGVIREDVVGEMEKGSGSMREDYDNNKEEHKEAGNST
jgi:hypothetical protein